MSDPLKDIIAAAEGDMLHKDAQAFTERIVAIIKERDDLRAHVARLTETLRVVAINIQPYCSCEGERCNACEAGDLMAQVREATPAALRSDATALALWHQLVEANREYEWWAPQSQMPNDVIEKRANAMQALFDAALRAARGETGDG